jgi:uncharacterized protein
MADDDSLLRFPCDFPIKVMGSGGDAFIRDVLKIVLEHAPDFNPEAIETRPSSSGKYLSVTCLVRVESREQLDLLYRALTRHEWVKIVL